MLSNGADIYKALLKAILKEGTETLYPDQAIILLNQSSEQWLKENSKKVDLDQRSIDDCKDAIELLSQTFVTPGSSYVALPADYFSTVRVMVKIFSSDTCIDEDEWQKVNIMKRDQESYVRGQSTYRKPKETKLYYKLTSYAAEGSRFLLFGGLMKEISLEYFKVFTQITNVTTLPTDMSHYASYILQEIVDIAERIYLERTQNPRYMSTLKEMTIKQEGE
jgi:hypothetical protein